MLCIVIFKELLTSAARRQSAANEAQDFITKAALQRRPCILNSFPVLKPGLLKGRNGTLRPGMEMFEWTYLRA